MGNKIPRNPHITPSSVEVWETPQANCEDSNHTKRCLWVESDNFYCAGDPPKGRRPRKPSGPTLLMGFDTEYKTPDHDVTIEEIQCGKAKYEVLSYQFHCQLPDGRNWSGICCPESNQRMTLGEFLVFALGKGVLDHQIEQLPTKITLIGHFTRADVPAFADFKDLTRNLANVRNTFISDNGYIPVQINYGHHEAPTELAVYLRDTMLLAPANAKSLAAIGDLVGQPKILLHEDPVQELQFKQNMDIVRATDWELFKRYAMNDAVICVKYAEMMLKQHREITGKPDANLPITLTSMGVELLDNIWSEKLDADRLELVGREEVYEPRWDKLKQRYKNKKVEVELPDLHIWSPLATECYHGGRNEQFWFGPSAEEDWSDFDLSSAYPTAMSLIGRADWRNSRYSQVLSDFTPTTLGFAWVDFEFPSSTRFPTLPVRTDNGLVFPLQGTSNCCAPELALAKELGAKLSIRHGCIIPTDSNQKIFGEFIKYCLAERGKHPKNTLQNLFWKELSNSTYGKTAQGLRDRRVFDMRDRTTKPLPPSKITNPFFAAFITSFVRATLGEIINRLPASASVFSCTTDGFLTNATSADIEAAQRGQIAQLFSEARHELTGKHEVLETKHQVRRLLGWRTRGQATLIPGTATNPDPNYNIVLAKSGLFTPRELDTDELENRYIVDMFLNRDPDQQIRVSAKTGIKDMLNYEADLVEKQMSKRLNMEFDWKRRPLEHFRSDFHDHVAFGTRPWNTVQEFQACRNVWKQFNDRTPTCIKTTDDFEAFWHFHQTTETLPKDKRKYLRTASGAAPDLTRLRQMLCSAWHQEAGGIVGKYVKGKSATTFAETLVAAGIPCKKSDVQNALHVPFDEHSCPRTQRCIEALHKLTGAFPVLDIDEFLSVEVIAANSNDPDQSMVA